MAKNDKTHWITPTASFDSGFPVHTFKAISYWPPDKYSTGISGAVTSSANWLLKRPAAKGPLNEFEICEKMIDAASVQVISDIYHETKLDLWIGRLDQSNSFPTKPPIVIVSDPKTGYSVFDELKECGITLTHAYGMRINPYHVKGYVTLPEYYRLFNVIPLKLKKSFARFNDGKLHELPEHPESCKDFTEKLTPSRPLTHAESQAKPYDR